MSERAPSGETMDKPLIMLTLELIGAGMIIAALAMLLTGQSARHRGPLVALATPALLVLGILLITFGLLGPEEHQPADEQALNELLKQTPLAADTNTAPRYHQISILVNATPSDDAKATPSERHSYASALASHLAESMVTAGISAKADAQAIPTEPWPESETQRRCQDQDLLVSIRLPAVRLPDSAEYALWREPNVALYWCAEKQRYNTQFRVLERAGDAVPYEQALRSHLLKLLQMNPPG